MSTPKWKRVFGRTRNNCPCGHTRIGIVREFMDESSKGFCTQCARVVVIASQSNKSIISAVKNASASNLSDERLCMRRDPNG